MDKDFNLFITISNNSGMLLKLNEAENSITTLATYANHGLDYHSVPCMHPETGMILMGSGGVGSRDRFITLDPKEGWAPKNHYIRSWKANGHEIPVDGTIFGGSEAGVSHYTSLYCEADGFYYTRYLLGQIVKINPTTWDAEVIYQTNSGIAWGMAFHPVRKTELWFAYDHGSGAELSNSICRMDVADTARPVEKLTGATNGGFRDGPISQAQFYGIRMMNFDSDGNLFVGENNNQTIRKVDTQTMMVETLVGIPGMAGFKDGKREEALFNGPHGLVIDNEGVMYITEYINCRVRRIAIE
jgi:hypothetical protein